MANSGVETDLLSEIQNAFLSEKQNLVVQNVGTQYDPVEVCLDRSVAETVNHVFKHKVRETANALGYSLYLFMFRMIRVL